MKRLFLIPGDLLSSVLLTAIGFLSLLGQFARVTTPVGRMSWFEPLLVLFSLQVLVRYGAPWRRWQQVPGWLWSVTVLIFWLLLVTAFRVVTGSPELWTQALPALGRLVVMIWFGVSVWQVCSERPNQVWNGSLLWLALHAVMGLGQYLLLPDTRQFLSLGWDEHFNRAFGTLFDPTFFGVLMAIGAVLSLQSGRKERTWWRVQAWGVVFALFLLSFTASFSRAVYLAYTVGVLTLAAATRQRKVLLAIPALVMALFFIPKDGGGVGQNLVRTQTIAMREEVVQKHAQALSWDALVFGRGWGYETLSEQTSQRVDSMPLFLLFTGGVPSVGLSLLTLLLAWKSTTDPLTLSILATLTIHSLIAPSWLYPWVQLAVVGVVVQKEERDL